MDKAEFQNYVFRYVSEEYKPEVDRILKSKKTKLIHLVKALKKAKNPN
jgi:hypothetical protein